MSNIDHPNHCNYDIDEIKDILAEVAGDFLVWLETEHRSELDENSKFNLDTAVMYIRRADSSRVDRKYDDSYVEDLQNAVQYLQREIQKVSKINDINDKFKR